MMIKIINFACLFFLFSIFSGHSMNADLLSSMFQNNYRLNTERNKLSVFLPIHDFDNLIKLKDLLETNPQARQAILKNESMFLDECLKNNNLEKALLLKDFGMNIGQFFFNATVNFLDRHGQEESFFQTQSGKKLAELLSYSFQHGHPSYLLRCVDLLVRQKKHDKFLMDMMLNSYKINTILVLKTLKGSQLEDQALKHCLENFNQTLKFIKSKDYSIIKDDQDILIMLIKKNHIIENSCKLLSFITKTDACIELISFIKNANSSFFNHFLEESIIHRICDLKNKIEQNIGNVNQRKILVKNVDKIILFLLNMNPSKDFKINLLENVSTQSEHYPKLMIELALTYLALTKEEVNIVYETEIDYIEAKYRLALGALAKAPTDKDVIEYQQKLIRLFLNNDLIFSDPQMNIDQIILTPDNFYNNFCLLKEKRANMLHKLSF